MMGSKTDIEEMTTCGICNSSFSESAPKILPCLHTVCANCITPIETSSGSSQTSPSTTFCCPYCKVPQFSQLDIEKLPINSSVACLVQILSGKPPTCQVCENSNNPSVALCYDCPCFLCGECMKLHVHAGHKNCKIKLLSVIDDLKFCPPVLPIFKVCPDHSKPMKFYCQKDETSVCEECVNDSHKDHFYSPIVQVMESKKRCFQKVINNCKSEVDDLQQAVNKIKEMRTHMLKRKEDNIRTLDNFFHKIERDILDQQRLEIKQSIGENHASRDNILQKQEVLLDSLLSQFKSICTFAENMLQYSAAQDVIDFEYRIIKRSEKLKEDKSKVVLTSQAEEQKLIRSMNEDTILESFSHIVSGIDIKKCKIIGPKSTTIIVGETIIFHVILYPLYDRYMLNFKSLTVQVQYLNSDNDEVTTEKVTIKRNIKADQSEDDMLEITYIATKTGDHMVSVLVEGQHIPRSPFQVTAWLRNYSEIDTEKCLMINKGSTQQQFKAPIGVATGPNDEIFVLDYGNPRIIVFKQDLTKERIIPLKEDEIRKPLGIAVHNDMIAISDDSSNCVKLFSFEGAHQSTIGIPRNKKDQFNHPYGLAFNSKGILYIVDSKNYRVQAFDTNHENQLCGELGSKGSNPGQFKGSPGYIAVDKKDCIYVTDYYGNSINIYDTDKSHAFLHTIMCKSAWAIAVTQDDCLLVSSNKLGSDRLRVFSPSRQIGCSHQLVVKLGSRGNDRGQFRRIYGIAVSRNGTIYVAEYGNNRIQIIYT